MATSSTVTAGTTILASAYNDLRIDVLDATNGHDHGGTNGKVLSLSSAGSALSADVALTAANTVYAVLTASLGAGTWLVTATCTFSKNVADVTALLDNNGGGTWYASGAGATAATQAATVTLATIITLASTTTVRLSAAASAAGSSVLRTAPTNGQAAQVATQLRAVKLATG